MYESTTRAADAFCIADSIVADESAQPLQINLNFYFYQEKSLDQDKINFYWLWAEKIRLQQHNDGNK